MRPRHAVLPTPSVSLRSVPLPHYLPKSFPCHTSENSPVSPIIATDPKTHLSKSCICHTSEIPPGVALASPTLGLPHPQAFQRFLQLSPIPFLFKLLRTLLSFFALTKTSTRLFSIASTLFAKNTGGGLRSSFWNLGFVHFVYAGLRDGIKADGEPRFSTSHSPSLHQLGRGLVFFQLSTVNRQPLCVRSLSHPFRTQYNGPFTPRGGNPPWPLLNRSSTFPSSPTSRLSILRSRKTARACKKR